MAQDGLGEVQSAEKIDLPGPTGFGQRLDQRRYAREMHDRSRPKAPHHIVYGSCARNIEVGVPDRTTAGGTTQRQDVGLVEACRGKPFKQPTTHETASTRDQDPQRLARRHGGVA